jgi:hypothetical protein
VDNDVPINIKLMLRVGDTLVPLIFMTDRIHLVNIGSDERDTSKMKVNHWKLPGVSERM